MPTAPAIGVEISPGYRLIDRIGFGGYGEVWKVAAPGGLEKAVKIVYGDLTGPRAEQELKSLERIKGVRHPFLLSLERFEALEGRLLIFSELADQSLLDRYRECKAAGLPGIPRAELLSHLRDAADALDYMSDKHGLQHLDIKPENLLLVSGRIKVADFGLVKEVLGTGTHITGGITPIYAAPEAFDGRASRQCDQYSLAIVYQEMLTGQRPFPGTTAFQLAAQHSCAPPLLDPLPPQDRPILARALSKIPQQRFGSCRELVEKLLTAPPPRQPAGPQPTDRLLSMDTALPGSVPALPKGSFTPLPRAPVATAEVASDPTGIRPTLFVGLGGLAGMVLRRLKRKLSRQYGDLKDIGILRMFLLDTDRASLRAAQQGRAAEALASAETLHCPLYPPEHYREQSHELVRWIDRRWLFGLPRSLQTEGLRPLGRLALMDNSPYLLSGLRQHLTALSSTEAKLAAVGATARGLRTEVPRVFVVAGITGGTGGGMLIDVAYAARQVMAELGLPDDGLAGLLVCSTGPKEDEVVRARTNAYATLRELQHWSRADVQFPGSPERSLQPGTPGRPPFSDGCYLLTDLEQARERGHEALADRLAEYLLFDVTHGAALDRLRYLSRNEAHDEVVWRSCGVSRLRFPRMALTESVNQVLCNEIVERWRGDPAPADRDQLERQAREELARHALGEEALLRRFHDELPVYMGRDPELVYNQLADPVLSAGEPMTAGGAGAMRLLAKIDQLLGPGVGPDGIVPPPTTLELRLQEEGKEAGRDVVLRLVAWLQEVVETPGLRVKAADFALNVLLQPVSDTIRNLTGQARQFQAARQTMRLRVSGKEGSKSGLIPATMRRLWRDSPRDDSLPWSLFCVRVEEMVYDAILQLLLKVQSGLRAWGQELSQARRKLAEVPTRLAAPPPEPFGGHPALGELLPYGTGDLGSAVTALLGHLPVDLSRQFDLLIQAEVLDAGGGLWGLLTGKVDTSRLSLSRSPASAAFWDLVCREQAGGLLTFRGELMKWGHTLVSEFLKGTDLLSLLLERYPDDDALQGFLRDRAALAAGTQPPGAWQHLVMVIPESLHAGVVREQALEALVGVPITVIEEGDSLLFVQEGVHPSLPDVASALSENDPELIELAGKLLTRRDVEWTDFPRVETRSDGW